MFPDRATQSLESGNYYDEIVDDLECNQRHALRVTRLG
jgi:hypothetical protein